MTIWKCEKCDATTQADAPPDKCPVCKLQCVFVDVTCYTPDCAGEGIDRRIGKDSE